MDPPTSYVFYPACDREEGGFVQAHQNTPPSATDEISPRFVPNYPDWYSVPPAAAAEIERPSKRRKLQSSPISASSSSQASPYSNEISQLVTHIPTSPCLVHNQDNWCFQQWALQNLAMETHIQPFSRRMAALGRLVCSCTTLGPQESEGYEPIVDDQQYYDPNQQYVAEKTCLALSTDARTFPPYYAWETYAGRYSDQNVISRHDFNGQQAFAPEPILNPSTSPQDMYTFSFDSTNATIPISAFTVARAHAQPDSADAQWSGPRPGKRGPFRDPSLRQETAYTRKIGCCIRCRMQRIRCDKNPNDPDGICLTCKKVTVAKTGQLPCLRYKIADIALYKSGQVPGFEWTRRWSNEVSDPIDTWASSEIRTIYISEGYSQNAMELQVRQFVPMEGDKLERTWSYRGEKRSASIPPFALVDMDKARKTFARHVDANINGTLKDVTGASGSLIRTTYVEAYRLSQKKNLTSEVSGIIQSTFRLWTSTRLNTISCFIVGAETLGMPLDVLDNTSPTPGKIPLPPVMGAQLNLVMIHQIQAKLRKTVLDQLQKIVQKNKHTTWLVTYFVDFILLHNASMIIAHDAGYAKKHGINRRFAREDKVKEYHMGANIILAYFHYCNKGLYPFSEECNDSELRGLAELDDRDLNFVRATRAYAISRERDWRRLRESDEYDHPEYYICQMFEQNWRPRAMV